MKIKRNKSSLGTHNHDLEGHCCRRVQKNVLPFLSVDFSVFMHCGCRLDVHLWKFTQRHWENRLPLYKNNDNNINIVKILNLMELDDQNPTCKSKVFLGMPPHTHKPMHTHTVSWKDWHLSTLINLLWELQTAVPGKICKVQTAKSNSKQPQPKNFI